MSKIVLGFSGGVDSTVSTMLLKKAGHEVYGLYMDNADEAARQCAIDAAEFIGVPLTVLDVSRLRELTFCLIYRQSTQREVIDPLFDAAGCKANLFLETGSNRANISMVRRGLSCSILPAHYVRSGGKGAEPMSTIYEIFGRDAHAMTIALMERAEVITAIPAGASVALKPNLVVAGQPEYGATTHAGVLSGAIEYLREHGVRDISIIEGSWVGDSTGRAFRAAGYDAVGKQCSVPL